MEHLPQLDIPIDRFCLLVSEFALSYTSVMLMSIAISSAPGVVSFHGLRDSDSAIQLGHVIWSSGLKF